MEALPANYLLQPRVRGLERNREADVEGAMFDMLPSLMCEINSW